jgi:DUF177 domain-containing protein
MTALQVNLRQLELQNVRLREELPAEVLDLFTGDEMIEAHRPLSLDLEVEKLENSLLVQGRLELVLDCECVRCLKPFTHQVKLAPWCCHIPLTGEGKATVENDCVDLTPYVREDIFLAFPQHPLCDPECGGLGGPVLRAEQARTPESGSSVWAALDQLKL